jgi:hypothetical protein
MNLKLKHALVLLISLNLIASNASRYCWIRRCDGVTKDCSWLHDSSYCNIVRQNAQPPKLDE